MNVTVQKNQVEKIKSSYGEKPFTEFDKLKSLDKKVKLPAKVFAYVFGTIGSLVLGTGMSLAMKVIGDFTALGIAVGMVGIIMTAITYPIYRAILKSRKAKYCKKIFELSEEILSVKD